MAHFRNVCKVGHSPTADPESGTRESHGSRPMIQANQCLNLSILMRIYFTLGLFSTETDPIWVRLVFF